MINSRRKFIKTLTVGFIGGNVLSSIPTTVLAKNYEKGIEIQKGYIVFNDKTQKVMAALAEALLPGSNEINMKGKVMDYVNSDRAAATIFDAGLWNINSLSVSKFELPFYQLKDKETINALISHIQRKNRIFYNQFRYLVFRLYYADSAIWKKLSYSGPPQTKGFMDYSEPPKK